MKNFKRSFKLLSLLLSVCMIVAICPVINASAEITYLNNLTGSDSISISNQSSTDVVFSKDVAGFNGKAESDVVYSYSGTNASTGSGYFSANPSVDQETHDADSQVIEFNIMFENETSEFHFSPAYYNSTGYEYFLANNKLSGTSGNGWFGSLNSFVKFTPNGMYITDYQYTSKSVRYVNSGFHNKYIKKDADGSTVANATEGDTLETGVWHTVAIRTPGLIESKGDSAYVNSAGTTVENAYAGENKTYICVDGVEYVIPMAQAFWGTRHIKFHGKNTVHFDNLKTYMTYNLEDPEDYKNSTALATLTSTSENVEIDGNDITITGDMTASQLCASLTGADAVRVYTASSDSAKVKLGDKVVAASKNGDAIERSYNYYNVACIIGGTTEPDEPTEPEEPIEPEEPEIYEEPGILDGDDDLSHGSGKNADGSKPKCTVEKI